MHTNLKYHEYDRLSHQLMKTLDIFENDIFEGKKKSHGALNIDVLQFSSCIRWQHNIKATHLINVDVYIISWRCIDVACIVA